MSNNKPATLLVGEIAIAVVLFFSAPRCAAQAGQFPDAHNKPPAGYTGPVFKLRQDYPTTPPPAETKPWESFSFETQSLQYVQSVLAYCLDGNVAVDWQLE
jgi:hypothetical protein